MTISHYEGIPLVTEGWISLPGEMHAVRLLFKHVITSRGFGLGQLGFVFEASSRHEAADNQPLWLGGTLRIVELHPTGNGYVAPLTVDIQPTVIPPRASRDITLNANITYQQFQLVEEYRIAGVKLRFDLAGHWLCDGTPWPFWGISLDHEVGQSDWIALLENVGYRQLILLELDSPSIAESVATNEAIGYYAQAQRHFLHHDWRHTVESLRQCLAALVGKRPDEEDQDSDVLAAAKELRKESRTRDVGYVERMELVRKALKFLCDLGAHPEVAETTKQDAQSALLMAAGLLRGVNGRV
jgi:hypothetical protein